MGMQQSRSHDATKSIRTTVRVGSELSCHRRLMLLLGLELGLGLGLGFGHI